LTYEPKGRRDPFSPVQVAVEKGGLDVATTKLVGIIQGHQPLALVEAPDGLGYILKTGDVLGNGRITDITANSVTFAVAGRAGQRETSLTLRLVKE
jgi:Tfp pilus assembly protein PilP